MEVTVTRQVDASDPDEDGAHDYRYEYDLFRFVDGGVAVVAMSYIDRADEALLVHLDFAGRESPVCDSYLKLPLVAAAVAYLTEVGKKKVTWKGPQGFERVGAAASS